MVKAPDPARIGELHDVLLAHFGPQEWWPGRTAFEVMAGAILVQRTRWENAARALRNLDLEGLLSPARLAACPLPRLEALVRSAGFYRQKARRLSRAAAWWTASGGARRLGRESTPALRKRLLEIDGIGPETADSILLYVFDRPAFIADAYARRLLRRLGWADGDVTGHYDSLANAVNAAVKEDAVFFNELHALIVVHGRSVCTATPQCPSCPLAPSCRYRQLNAGPTGRPGSGR